MPENCSRTAEAIEGKGKGTIAFVGGRILTMDPGNEGPEAVVIGSGRILAVGDRNIIKDHPEAAVRDLGGQALLPAFIDSHNHLSFACYLPLWVDLHEARTKERVLAAIKGHLISSSEKWVVGYPWSDVEDRGELITREELDKVCPDRPMALVHGTFHKMLVNTRALEMTGLLHTCDPRMMKGLVLTPEGVPTGVVCETSEIPVFEAALSAGPGKVADLIERRARTFLPYGITSIQDPGVTPLAERAYRMLHAEGRLPVSVLMMPHGKALLDNDVFDRLEGEATGTGDEQLRVGPVKLFADGGFQGTTANGGMIGGRRFTSAPPRDDFARPLIEATRNGFQVCVHALGNIAVDAVLDAFKAAEGVGPNGFVPRPRIEHVPILSQEQIQRMAELGMCASVQPFFLKVTGGSRRVCFDGFKWFPFLDLDKAGVHLCANSDDPGFGSMTCIDPVKGALLGSSLGDKDSSYYFPEQALTFERWLWMYTAGAAYAGGLENERGMIREGMVADLVVLSSPDPKAGPVVNETWKEGVRVFSRQDGAE